MNQVERAALRFEEGFSCSQSVFSAFAPQLGLDCKTALKVAGAFGGGMGRMGETCGAVTGAFMVIGLKHGRTEADDEEAKERTYELAREFARRFERRNGSIMCRELLGRDIGIPEQRMLAKEEGLFATLCSKFVRDAAEILEQIVEMQMEQET
jgi:C_GCAxxG_C_C family probable redox protein